jgi:hypothetical protein
VVLRASTPAAPPPAAANDGKSPVVVTPLMQWLMQRSEEKVRARNLKKGKEKADAKRGGGAVATARPAAGMVRLLGDAESSLGDANSSLGDAKSSLGDAKSSLGGR